MTTSAPMTESGRIAASLPDGSARSYDRSFDGGARRDPGAGQEHRTEHGRSLFDDSVASHHRAADHGSRVETGTVAEERLGHDGTLGDHLTDHPHAVRHSRVLGGARSR